MTKENYSKSTIKDRVECQLTGGHEWVSIPLPMSKGPLEPTLEIHYSCKKCKTNKRHNLMDVEFLEELDERFEQLTQYYQGVEDG